MDNNKIPFAEIIENDLCKECCKECQLSECPLRENEKPIIINIPAVETWTITDLRYTCRKNKIKGYTKMDRQQLIIEVNEIIKKSYSKFEI